MNHNRLELARCRVGRAPGPAPAARRQLQRADRTSGVGRAARQASAAPRRPQPVGGPARVPGHLSPTPGTEPERQHFDGTAGIDRQTHQAPATRRQWESADGAFGVLRGGFAALRRARPARQPRVGPRRPRPSGQGWMMSSRRGSNRKGPRDPGVLFPHPRRQRPLNEAKVIFVGRGEVGQDVAGRPPRPQRVRPAGEQDGGHQDHQMAGRCAGATR